MSSATVVVINDDIDDATARARQEDKKTGLLVSSQSFVSLLVSSSNYSTSAPTTISCVNLVALILAWWFFSVAIVMTNNSLMTTHNFEYPIILALLGPISTSASIEVVRALTFNNAIEDNNSIIGKKAPESFFFSPSSSSSYKTAALKAFPTAACTALSFVLGQLEYRYLSVSAITMLKALMPIITLVISVGFSLETCSFKLAGSVAIIVAGTLLTSYGGEASFDLFGVILCFADMTSFALAVCFQQILLNGWTTTNALRAIAPLTALLLSLAMLIIDGPKGIVRAVYEMFAVGLHSFAGVCIFGTMTLWTSTAVVKHTSALWRMVLNQAKGLILIASSVIINHDIVTNVQMLGWIVCCAGIATYTMVKQQKQRHDVAMAPMVGKGSGKGSDSNSD
uniref:Sugar phosphate transporter domain-containing protein n=1 Tax=Pycnococcus provasolii TaxID=41880 RepID=A0A7S2BEM0_9CHLO